MFYTLTATYANSVISFSGNNFQPGDVVQFASPTTNQDISAALQVETASGQLYPLTYNGSEVLPAYLLYVGQIYTMAFTGTYFEITAQQVINSSGEAINTQPLVVNNFIDPSTLGLLNAQMVDIIDLVNSVSRIDVYTTPLTAADSLLVSGGSGAYSLSVTGNSSLDGGLVTTGAITAAPGTSGSEVINYNQITEGGLTPQFNQMARPLSQINQNWLVNSSFLYGLVGWVASGISGYNTVGDYDEFTYFNYGGAITTQQTLSSSPVAPSVFALSGQSITISGWIYNGTSSGPANLQANFYNSSNVLISSLSTGDVPSGSSWTFASATGAVPSTTSYCVLDFNFQGSSAGSNIGLSQVKLESGQLATLWSDESSANLFLNGTFTPKFESLTLVGNESVMGEITAAGSMSCSGFSCTVQSTMTGASSGSVVSTMPDTGTFKKFVAYADAYGNDTTTSQSITFPVAFTYPPAVTTNASGLSVTASTTTFTITTPDSTTLYTGLVIVEGI